MEIGEQFAPGAGGFAAPVVLDDGTHAVLKLATPHREAEQEADALERWNGEGAVRLLARNDERWALLLERAEPGSFLSESPDALEVLAGLLPRLWTNAVGFHTLEDETGHWTDEIQRSARDPGLRDAALRYIGELAHTQGEQVLVHQDLHGDNVLAAPREPWLVIDPKPLAGEREFAVAPIVRSFELGHRKRDVLHRSTGSRPSSVSTASAPAAGRSRRPSRGRTAPSTSSRTSRSRAGCWRKCEPSRRPLRRRLHARAAGAGARARGVRSRCGERFGLVLEPARYEDRARDAALLDLKRHPELDHDEEIWVAFTERIVLGMGGRAGVARRSPSS